MIQSDYTPLPLIDNFLAKLHSRYLRPSSTSRCNPRHLPLAYLLGSCSDCFSVSPGFFLLPCFSILPRTNFLLGFCLLPSFCLLPGFYLLPGFFLFLQRLPNASKSPSLDLPLLLFDWWTRTSATGLCSRKSITAQKIGIRHEPPTSYRAIVFARSTTSSKLIICRRSQQVPYSNRVLWSQAANSEAEPPKYIPVDPVKCSHGHLIGRLASELCSPGVLPLANWRTFLGMQAEG